MKVRFTYDIRIDTEETKRDEIQAALEETASKFDVNASVDCVDEENLEDED